MVKGDLEIRPAGVEDAPAISECVAAAYRHYIARLGKPPGPMLHDYTGIPTCYLQKSVLEKIS
jgi:hypothetical protein